MAEYIEREAAKRAACDALELYRSEYDAIEESIDKVPAADVAHVRHGQWLHHYYDNGEQIDDKWYCSECAMCGEYKRSWYCPNCGAKMDG